jgi:hypothetical protein
MWKFYRSIIVLDEKLIAGGGGGACTPCGPLDGMVSPYICSNLS